MTKASKVDDEKLKLTFELYNLLFYLCFRVTVSQGLSKGASHTGVHGDWRDPWRGEDVLGLVLADKVAAARSPLSANQLSHVPHEVGLNRLIVLPGRLVRAG